MWEVMWEEFVKIQNEETTLELKINKFKCTDNPFAMKEVASWYAENEFYSDVRIEKNYLKWLNKIIVSIENKYKDENNDYPLELRKLLSWAYEMKGLVYSEKGDEESQDKAIEYLEKAEKLADFRDKFELLDTKNGNVIESEKTVNPVLARLRAEKRLTPYVKAIQYMGFVSSLSGESLEDIKKNSENKAKEIIGNNWDKLDNTSKKQLVTAIYTIKVMEDANGSNEQADDVFDYSSIVGLLSRALEYEIKLRFYKGYLEYLSSSYSADEYLAYNNIVKPQDIKSRKLVVDSVEQARGTMKTSGFHEYEGNGEKQFTLGSIQYPIGFSFAANDKLMDKSFYDYCKTMLWEAEADEKEISDWVKSICTSVMSLRETRNHASHGGYNLTKNEAQNAVNEIILIGKILVRLLDPCK